ncbi:MAG: ORF6C domain-containing protein [Turicibacter sp.]|nr:ORF6C domain-containing protein [Turicibacter sp.]
MGNLINIINQDGVAVVSSRVVAQDFGKEHRNVTRDIEELISNMGGAQNRADLFIESQYQHPQNKQWYKEYLLTRDGFSLLVMGFTGKEALRWKLQYIEAFNKMEEMIKQQIQTQIPNSPMDILKVMFSALEEQKQDIVEVKQDVQNFKEEMPIFTSQRKEISKRVRSLGVDLLGGKRSTAYQDKSLRNRLYSDIYSQIHREFGVGSCDDIKRRDYSAVFSVIHNYSLPMHLANDIEYANTQMNLAI